MASNIRTYISLIDESYPKPGVNQSSAGFRNNYDAIKKALVIADTEVSDMHVKKIVIEGDATGVSGLFGAGPNDPAAIQLVLSPSGVTAGSYDSTRASLQLTVDAKGRLTSVTRTADPTFPVQGTYASYAVNSTPVAPGNRPVATKELKVPKFKLNEYGDVTEISEDTITGFGIVGHSMPRGSIIAGDPTNESNVFEAPLEAEYTLGDMWALTWEPLNGNFNHLVWKKLPAFSAGTMTGVTAGIGIKLINTQPTNPIINFDIPVLPEFPTAGALDNLDYTVVYDGSSSTHYKIPTSRLGGSGSGGSGGGGLSAVKDDLNPVLGGGLDTKGFLITNTRGSLQLRPQVGDLLLNNMKFPRVPGLPGNVLTTDGVGSLTWQPPVTTPPGVTLVTSGPGLRTTPTTGIISTGSIGLNFSSLPSRAPDPIMDFVATQRSTDSSMGRSSLSSLLPKLGLSIVVDDTVIDATNAKGTFTSPFKTITAALAAIPTPNYLPVTIVIMPGEYREDVLIDKPYVTLTSIAGAMVTRIKGQVTVNPGLTHTRLNNLFIDIKELGSDVNVRALKIINGVDNFMAVGCYFDRMSYYDNPWGVIDLAGEKKGVVQFQNCMINGEVLQNMYDIVASETGEQDIYVMFTNTIGSLRGALGLRAKPNSYTVVDGSGALGCLIHEGGYVEITNSRLMPNLEGYGIVSTAPASGVSQAGQPPQDNYLTLNNVNMQGFQAGNVLYALINKTGACGYQLNNVNRDASLDILNGPRDGYGISSVDVGDALRKVSGANIPVNVNVGSNWEITLSTNTTVALSAPAFPYTMRPTPPLGALVDSRFSVRKVTVMVRQDSNGGRTLNFTAPSGETIIWNGSPSMLPHATGAGQVTMYEFTKMGTTWMGTRTFVQA